MGTSSLLQRTDDWYEARRNRLTASDFANAAGLVGAYQSRAHVFKVKVGVIVVEVSLPMMFGIEHEEDARDDYEIATGNISMPTGFHVHSDHDWLGASPDGIIGGTILHEAKCRATEPYESISPLHFCQVQGQLACTGLKECHYQSWTPDSQRIWRIEYDPEYWEWIFPYLQEFWSYYQKDEEPPRRKRVSYSKTIEEDLLYSSESLII